MALKDLFPRYNRISFMQEQVVVAGPKKQVEDLEQDLGLQRARGEVGRIELDNVVTILEGCREHVRLSGTLNELLSLLKHWRVDSLVVDLCQTPSKRRAVERVVKEVNRRRGRRETGVFVGPNHLVGYPHTLAGSPHTLAGSPHTLAGSPHTALGGEADAADFAGQRPRRVGLIGTGWYGKSDLFR